METFNIKVSSNEDDFNRRMEDAMRKEGLSPHATDPYTEQFKAAQAAMVSCDPATVKLRQDLARVADMPFSPKLKGRVCAMIMGESGTGKELAARILHGRRKGAFVAVNCSALPAGLFEVELFGCRKGAFTDANTSREGKCVAAAHGTLFLDEIGDLPADQQAKLLRVIETREVTPLGENRPIPISCQFVSATNHKMREAMLSNRFRQDLYFRLAMLEFYTVPLRDRPCDVPLIVEAMCREYEMSIPDVMPDIDVYKSGNVRALLSWLIKKEIHFL